jgi:hypothetical protein
MYYLCLAYSLAGQTATLDSSVIASMLLNENGLENIVTFNPFIAKPQDLLFAVSTVMFFVSRINQSNHIITEAQTLKGLLTQIYSPLTSSRYAASFAALYFLVLILFYWILFFILIS